jgi:hypothetical protein
MMTYFELEIGKLTSFAMGDIEQAQKVGSGSLSRIFT